VIAPEARTRKNKEDSPACRAVSLILRGKKEPVMNMTVYQKAAETMLMASPAEFNGDDVDTLADDLEEMVEEGDTSAYWRESYGECPEDGALKSALLLKQRIGGLENLRSYLDCLQAGKKRRGRDAKA
jgi:hypothetical protein